MTAVLTYANNYLPGFLAGEAGVLSDRGFIVAIFLLGVFVFLNFLVIRFVALRTTVADQVMRDYVEGLNAVPEAAP